MPAATELLPNIVKIEFGTEKHTKVLDYVMRRVQAARARRTNRQAKWADAENLFTSYVKETDADARRRSTKREQGYPTYTTITIPYSYATLMTAHTYWTSVFLARDPVLQVQGQNGEAQSSEQAVEAMLQYFLVAGKNLVPFYIWLLDQGKYGEGIMGMCWDVDVTYVPQLVVGPKTLAGVPIPMTQKKTWTSQKIVGYEGIRFYNVRPYDFLFDPTVTLQNFQNGEFAGHESFVPILKIKEGEYLGKFFNVDKVEGRARSLRSSNQSTGQSTELPSQNIPGGIGKVGDQDSGGVDLTEITVEIVPRELGLANREYIEKWTFTIANDTVLVSAQPQGWFHNNFMYDTLEHEVEGYNVSKRGMMEMLQPLNQTLDWLINTHFFNVRKVLNDQIIYDPSVLVSKDVESPGPGKLIRVRPERYGTDVRTAFYQMQIGDVTQNHIKDAMLIIEMIQRLTGVNDTVMGLLNNSRRTATEVRSSSSFAVNRLKTQCEYYSAMGFAPLTSRAIKVAQQMMQGRDSRYYRIVGNQADPNQRFLSVGPEEIAGQFDFMPVDGTMPIDRQAMASVLGNLFQQMGQLPQVAQAYDFAKFFGYIAQLSGVRNLDRFKVQVVPDMQAMMGAQAGNLVPTGAAVPPGGAPPNMLQNNAGIQQPEKPQ